MTSPYPSLSKMALRPSISLTPNLRGLSWYDSARCHSFSSSLKYDFQNIKQHKLSAMNMTAGQSDDPGKFSLKQVMDKTRNYWDKCPQPVKIFPWNKVLENFIQLILDLTLTVVKFLCIPLLAISSLSEMSYCAAKRKLFLTPIPLLLGGVFAGILKESLLEVSPLLKDKGTEIPWHLVAVAIFFTLLKFLGPYYPYWGRLFIPHFANGGLWRALWDSYLWYRKPNNALDTTSDHDSSSVTYSD